MLYLRNQGVLRREIADCTNAEQNVSLEPRPPRRRKICRGFIRVVTVRKRT